MVADPTALTAARAPTVKPCGMRVLPNRGRFQFTVVGAEAAPTVPNANSAAAGQRSIAAEIPIGRPVRHRAPDPVLLGRR